MIAELKKTNDNRCFCSNCRMVQLTIKPICFFCESVFSNYENFLIENFKEELKNEING